MAIDPCNPCGCDPAGLFLQEQSAWVSLGRILCELLTAVEEIAVATGAAQPTDSTVTPIPQNAASVTAAAANPNRRGLILFNDAEAIAYIKLGATASTTSYTVQLDTGGTYILTAPVYTGIVDVIWASGGAGNLLVTEILP